MIMFKDNKTLSEANKQLITYILISVLLIALTTFCYFVNYPLVLPLLLFILSIHLSIFRKTGFRFFLNLSLLLVLIVFTTHAITFYTEIPFYYIPVSSIAMLTMLLLDHNKVS